LRTAPFTQLVLIPKLWEEYTSMDRPVSHIPAVAGQVRVKGDGDRTVNDTIAKMYWSASATCMYIMQWSHPGICNAVYGLARHMTAPRKSHN
jgi:hypothetical protein